MPFELRFYEEAGVVERPRRPEAPIFASICWGAFLLGALVALVSAASPGF
jgi:hypothetical protein